MAANKKRAASKRKGRAPKPTKGGRPKTKQGKKAPVPRGSPKKLTQKPKSRAAVLAAFSAKVLEEEEEPVAVRSFIEARQGVEASKELHPKTGETTPTTEFEEVGDEDDTDEDIPSFKPAPPPKIEPLAGPFAVPKNRKDEEFRIATPSKKGKVPDAPSKDDLGKIELRMQRGSGDATIGHASPDYLQRSFNRAKEAGRVAAPSTRKGEKSTEQRFEVAKDKPTTPKDPTLLDFGDVEIAQQTRSGRKKLGRLETEDAEDKT